MNLWGYLLQMVNAIVAMDKLPTEYGRNSKLDIKFQKCCILTSQNKLNILLK